MYLWSVMAPRQATDNQRVYLQIAPVEAQDACRGRCLPQGYALYGQREAGQVATRRITKTDYSGGARISRGWAILLSAVAAWVLVGACFLVLSWLS